MFVTSHDYQWFIWWRNTKSNFGKHQNTWLSDTSLVSIKKAGKATFNSVGKHLFHGLILVFHLNLQPLDGSTAHRATLSSSTPHRSKRRFHENRLVMLTLCELWASQLLNGKMRQLSFNWGWVRNWKSVPSWYSYRIVDAQGTKHELSKALVMILKGKRVKDDNFYRPVGSEWCVLKKYNASIWRPC